MNICGKYVTLRAVEESDLCLLQTMMNDPCVSDVVLGYNYPVSVAHQKKWFENNINCTDPLEFIIDTVFDGAIGLINLRDFDWINRSAEIGYKTLESKNSVPGIIFEALELILDYGFNTLNLHRVKAATVEYNQKTISIMKRCGSVIEGVERDAIFRHGKYWGLIHHSILENDFREIQKRRNENSKSYGETESK